MEKQTTTTVVEGNKTTTTVIQGNKKTTTETTVTEEIISNNEKTQIVAVLDRSGSMGTRNFIDTAIEKFNEYIMGQQALPGEASLSVHLFDDRYEVLYDNKDLKLVKPITKKEWYPRDMTRLFDAVGKAINTVTSNHKFLDKKDVPEKVLFLIYTDGGENDSKEFTSEAIKSLIKEKEAQNWNFIFLGANQDSFSTAQTLGVSVGNTINFVQSADGAEKYNTTLSSVSTKYRSMSTTSDGFAKLSKTMVADDE